MRGPGLALIAIGAVSAMTPGIARAQLKNTTESGSRIQVAPAQLAVDRTAAVAHGIGQCMYRKNPKAAAALLANSDPLTVEGRRANIPNLGTAFSMESCVGDEVGVAETQLGMRMPVVAIRALLAEQAYVAKVRQRPTLDANATEQVRRTFVSEGDVLARAKLRAGFSDCVVFKDVAGADALMRTLPGSPQEKAAARALAPALGSCLYEGENISLNVRSIRGYVADGLWARFAQ